MESSFYRRMLLFKFAKAEIDAIVADIKAEKAAVEAAKKGLPKET